MYTIRIPCMQGIIMSEAVENIQLRSRCIPVHLIRQRLITCTLWATKRDSRKYESRTIIRSTASCVGKYIRAILKLQLISFCLVLAFSSVLLEVYFIINTF